MIFKQKELVLLPYPFSDQVGSKVRPAIIVSNDNFNKRCEDCVMVPLTTLIKDEPFSLIVNQDSLESGKLLKQSRVRIDKIFTIKKSLIIMQIGKINDKTLEKIKIEISKVF
ncbi:type II toxin-antitoxin system PemK/MazF family toxin [Candidatus Pacearchaeota archaeon]|nr:type II toxin-antitoxin system PemK/MazF family toxin [Candidatus Pacearchaeota archaeon]